MVIFKTAIHYTSDLTCPCVSYIYTTKLQYQTLYKCSVKLLASKIKINIPWDMSLFPIFPLIISIQSQELDSLSALILPPISTERINNFDKPISMSL